MKVLVTTVFVSLSYLSKKETTETTKTLSSRNLSFQKRFFFNLNEVHILFRDNYILLCIFSTFLLAPKS